MSTVKPDLESSCRKLFYSADDGENITAYDSFKELWESGDLHNQYEHDYEHEPQTDSIFDVWVWEPQTYELSKVLDFLFESGVEYFFRTTECETFTESGTDYIYSYLSELDTQRIANFIETHNRKFEPNCYYKFLARLQLSEAEIMAKIEKETTT